MIFKRSVHFTPARHLTEAAAAAAKVAHTGRRVNRRRLRSNIIACYNSSHTCTEWQGAAARGLDSFWAAGSQRGACAKNGKVRAPPPSGKNWFASKSYVHGDRGCRNPTPAEIAKTRGLASSAIEAKKLKGLPCATRKLRPS